MGNTAPKYCSTDEQGRVGKGSQMIWPELHHWILSVMAAWHYPLDIQLHYIIFRVKIWVCYGELSCQQVDCQRVGLSVRCLWSGPIHLCNVFNFATSCNYVTLSLLTQTGCRVHIRFCTITSSIFYACDVIVVEICQYKVTNWQLRSKNFKWNWVYLCSQP